MKSYKYSILGTIIIAIALIIVGIPAVKANPIFFPASVQTSTATTSPTYILTGRATSTSLVYDSFGRNPNDPTIPSGNTTGSSNALVMVEMVASTTPGSASLQIFPQYSTGYNGIDCYNIPTACEWFEDGGVQPNFASTTKLFDITTTGFFTMNFSSSTPDKRALPLSGAATSTRAFWINTPVRYTRLVVVSPVGATPATFWIQVQATKERAE